MSIYDDVITAQQLVDECFDLMTGEIDEEQELQAKKLLDEVLSQGLEKLCKVRANKVAYIDNLKSEEKRIADKRKAEEKKLESLEGYILAIHKQSGQEKSIAGTFTVGTRKSTSVFIEDDFDNENYQTIEEVKKIDKNAIKNAIKSGLVVDGARLIENINLSIK